MSWVITKKDIPFLSLGAKFLSCGGGGETKTVEYLLLSVMEDSDMIVVKTIVELMKEWIVPVAMVGSSVLSNEDLPSGTEVVRTLELYETITGKNTDAVISIEIGGINGLTPLVAALERNIPVIDGDGMGRAFPDLEMTTFFDSHVPLFPLAAVSECEDLLVSDQSQFEGNFHSFILENNGYCHVACYGMNGSQMKAAMVPGTLKLARDIGEALVNGSLQAKLQSLRILFSNSVYGEMKVVFWGRITSIHRWFDNDVLVGSCHLSGQWANHGQSADVYFQNEFLSITSGKKGSATPDLIVFLHCETGLPLSVSDIREGMLLSVLVIPAPSKLYTKDLLRTAGPTSFGIPKEFSPAGKEMEGPYNENWD